MGDMNHSIVSTFGVGLSINDENAITLNTGTVNFSNNATVSGLLTVGSLNILPAGIIMAFGGNTTTSATSAPPGWWLCDGSLVTNTSSSLYNTNTPDLRGRFILGSGSGGGNIGSNNTSTAVGYTSGEVTHILQTTEMPTHLHSGLKINSLGGYTEMHEGGDFTYDNNGQTGTAGGSGAHNNMPPYYILTYIMKT
jgi:microcystin-dependent protein